MLPVTMCRSMWIRKQYENEADIFSRELALELRRGTKGACRRFQMLARYESF